VIEGLLVAVVVLQLVTVGLLWQLRREALARPMPAPPSPSHGEGAPASEPASPMPEPSAPEPPSSLPPEEPARAAVRQRWDEVLQRAARAGLLGLPSTEEVMQRLDQAGDGPRWLCVVLGRSLRGLLVDRPTAERTEVAVRRALDAVARLVDELDGDWQMLVEPPRGVSTRDETWLVDEPLAAVLGNMVVNDVLQPMVVLRPALFLGEVCAVEGEVA